jgi:FKBP-type peptidyl-prolyl cis-trans isomerase
LDKEERYTEPDFNAFYDLLALLPIEKNLRTTENYFNVLRQDLTYIALSEHIYIKNLENSENALPSEILQKEHSRAMFSYVAYLPTQNEWLPINAESHTFLNLNELIPGLALGVQGMKIGELREIHIHPNESYGFIADYETSVPLKFLIRLECIDINSSPLFLRPKPVALKRALLLTQNEIDTLNTMTKELSYHTGKKFWNFYKTVISYSGNDIIDQLKIVWNTPKQNIDERSIYHATLAVYAKQYQREKDRAQMAFKNRGSAVPLKENLLYIQQEKQGHGRTSWPKSIALTYKDFDGNILKKSLIESLTLEELERLCQGLQIGLRNCTVGDKGTFLIHPDLTDQGLFRNKLAHKSLLVEFEVHDIQKK